MNKQELEKKIRQAVHQLVMDKNQVSPLDLLLHLEKLTPKLVEEWRFRRVPYLERVTNGGLGQLSFIMKVLRQTAREMELKESYSAYVSWGKGPKKPLRFSKSGDPNVERGYSMHYLKPAPPKPPVDEPPSME